MMPVAVNDEQVNDDGEDFVDDDGGGDDPWAEVVTVKVINALYMLQYMLVIVLVIIVTFVIILFLSIISIIFKSL